MNQLFSRIALIVVCLIGFVTTASAESRGSSFERLKSNPTLKDVSNLAGLQLDIRYATPSNFLNEAIYGDYKSCFLHKDAAVKLARAIEQLKKSKPGFKLLIFDCLRPRAIQRKMWERVKGTDHQKYVANPHSGSVHNFGFAIDLSLVDDQGHEVDMGTPFDFFGPLAEPEKEDEFLKLGQLSPAQIENRKILRSAMEAAGFLQLPIEWWHFDALPKSEILKRKFKIIE